MLKSRSEVAGRGLKGVVGYSKNRHLCYGYLSKGNTSFYSVKKNEVAQERKLRLCFQCQMGGSKSVHR